MVTVFPPENYRPTPTNALLANALDLTAPASDILLKNRKSAWVQLTGHPGFFAPASAVTVWKRQVEGGSAEKTFYRALQHDHIKAFLPKFYREIHFNNDFFIEIEDLLQNFDNPSVMDIKMGTRTFLESEVENSRMREDLYKKMVAIDVNAPSADEHQLGAVTKLKYMQFRENQSSSTNLGFRIEALKMAYQAPQLDWKKTKTDKQVAEVLSTFVGHSTSLCRSFINHLHTLTRHLDSSKFFKTHEIIGSSLLLMHDRSGATGTWMIDFSKTLPLPSPIKKITHRLPWQPGNHEDGYLLGLDNLISLLTTMSSTTSMPSSPLGNERSLKLNHS